MVFVGGTIGNAVLFLFLSRALLPAIGIGRDVAGTGPATPALNLIPLVVQLVIGCIEVALILYFVAGIGEERVSSRRPMP
jgi:hypothetical protein